jgi:predicted nucleic acid-binding protein
MIIKNIFLLIENNKVDGCLCAITITAIYYLIQKNTNKIKANEIIEKLLQIFNIAKIDKTVLLNSLKNNGVDFEDSVIYTSAEYCNIEAIITRNKKGFKNSNIKVLQPKEFLEKYN